MSGRKKKQIAVFLNMQFYHRAPECCLSAAHAEYTHVITCTPLPKSVSLSALSLQLLRDVAMETGYN